MEKKENYQASLPTIFPSLHEYYSIDDSHCHNHLHSQMANEEALMVPQKEVQELSYKYAKEEVHGGKVDNAIKLMFLDENLDISQANEGKRKRKRPRIKTNEEVENQRMTHIAVERNRRKQMNEHLRVLRSIMPGSYVQRGDQASIVGGAIEFVRELEQLLQCLESQKRRRLYGDDPIRPPILEDSSTSSLMAIQNPTQPPLFSPLPLSNEYEAEIQEETAESKSHLADVEVKLQAFDNATIKILSTRRPGQLINTISALEDLQLNILHTNITTIEQTVQYSFNVKISGDTRYTADNIANLVQQIFSFNLCM